ncbi:MAG TPA: hypothetical protein VMF60_09395 [Acidimicrobiales bacterium]|nr:hypothetical protein [Acidimicrobiales bacterium]
MRLEITTEQARAVKGLLAEALRDMSHEIAATENPAYRAGLVARRQLLTEVDGAIGALLVGPGPAGDATVPARELAHPGG